MSELSVAPSGSMAQMEGITECCLKGFQWDGTPCGTESKLGENDTYITGSNPKIAILVIADLFGWTFVNTRMLADHYAREVDATVYVPDLYAIQSKQVPLSKSDIYSASAAKSSHPPSSDRTSRPGAATSTWTASTCATRSQSAIQSY